MENFDGLVHIHTLMQKQGTTQEEIKDAYVAWSQTYEQASVYLGVYMIYEIFFHKVVLFRFIRHNKQSHL